MLRFPKQRRKQAPKNSEIDWARERHYWRNRLDELYHQIGISSEGIPDSDTLVPSAQSIQLIQGTEKATPDIFYAKGFRSAFWYLNELLDYGMNPRELESVLEFGVGYGRLIRCLFPISAALYGCDLRPEAVQFVQANFPERLNVVQSGNDPPLPYQDSQFDFIFANSVFTHISPSDTPVWIKELARISKQGAIVIVSVFDPNHYLRHLTPAQFAEAERIGELAWGRDTVRENYAWLSQKRLRAWWGEHFQVLELRQQFLDQAHLIMRRQ